MSVVVRKANKEDMPEVLALIKELAVYEKQHSLDLVLIHKYRFNFLKNAIFALNSLNNPLCQIKIKH